MAFRKSGMMLATAITLSTCGTGALAFDDGGFRQRPHHHHWRGPHNFYSGSAFVFRDRGNGTYIYSTGSGTSVVPKVILAPALSPKIIDVASQGDACSWEHGVCVIRGSN